MKLNEKQLEFLEKELNITEKDIEGMSADEWKNVREKCFFIEADELMDLEDNEDGEETERCQLATSIASLKFSELTNNKSVA